MDKHLQIPDHEVAKPVRELLRLLSHRGAWFSPDLVVYGHNGDLSIRSVRSHTDRRSYIRVPLACMPLIEDFAVAFREDSFVCSPVNEDVANAHRDVMSLMFDVYNETKKAVWWSSFCPFIALQPWADVRSYLVDAKRHVPKVLKLQNLILANDFSTLMVESFLGARLFNLDAMYLNGSDGTESGQRYPVLLPLIDYFNHSLQAEGFTPHLLPSPPSMRVFGVPDETGEIFVRYNLYDPLDTLLFYGFVDVNAPWLASVPLALKLPDGRSLKVLNAGGTAKKNLSQPVHDLRMYLPMVQHPDAEEILISKLLVPGPAAPRALQRVLAYLLQSLGPGLKRADLLQWVGRLEKELLERNLQWWEELDRLRRDVPEELPIGRSLKDLCSFSQKHLRSYCSDRPPLG